MKTFMLLIYLLTLTLGTAFYGANFPLAQNLLPLTLGVLALASLRSPSTLRVKDKNLLYILIIAPIAIVLSWAALQMGQLPPHPIYSLIPTSVPAVSLNTGSTLAQLVLALGYGAAATLLYRLSAHQGTPARLLKGAALIVIAASFYGLVVFALGNHWVFLQAKIAYPESLTSTFINRNSFATFAGMGMLACLGLFLERAGEVSARLEFPQRLKAFTLLVIRPSWPWLLGAGLCALALVLTGSRAGLGASALGLLVMLGSLIYARPALRLPIGGLLVAVVISGTLMLAMAGSTLGSRLSTLSTDAATRSIIQSLTYEAIAQAPITGQGFGAYEDTFRTVRSNALNLYLNATVDHAHNTYLELATELGLPALTLLTLAVGALLAFFLNGLLVRRRAVMWPALGLGTFTLLATHAMYDFSLSMPAVTLMALTLIVPALTQSMAPLPEDNGIPSTPAASSRLPAGILAASLATLVAVTFPLTLSSWFSYQAWPAVAATKAGLNVQPQAQKQALQALTRCLEIQANHPTCAYDAAVLRTALANRTQLGTVMGDVRRQSAIQSLENALEIAPASSALWLRLAWMKEERTGNPETAVIPLINSILTAPADPAVAFPRARTIVRLWPSFSGDNKELAAANLATLWNGQPYLLWKHLRSVEGAPAVMAEVLQKDPTAPEIWQKVTHQPLASPAQSQ